MKTAYLRFYEELNDFLPKEKRKLRFPHDFTGSPSVKDLIESTGVPHSEIDMILVNGTSVDFSFHVNDNDDISVYPVFESFDVSEVQHLRKAPLRISRFIFDVHLGSAAKYMRMAGFDSFYSNSYSDKEIIEISVNQNRIIITKDRELLKNNDVTHGYWLRSTLPEEQVLEIVRRFQLEKEIKPFTRCMECNSTLQDSKKEDIESQLPSKVRMQHTEFKMCPSCSKIYWKGSHYEKMHIFIEKMLGSL